MSGFNLFDTTADPRQPTFIRQFGTQQFGWKQLVANGSGLGIATSSANSTDDGPHDLDLYTLGADGRQSEFLTTLTTPGLAAAVSIYNGMAYVADSEAGLQVVNYLAYDNKKLAPTITLSSSYNLATAEEGSLMRLTAAVTDDVQVRNVEFYVDDALVVIDGNYPFETRLVTPAMSAEKTNFKVKARATDTGGNATWSTEYTLTLVPDATPPVVAGFYPEDGSVEQFAKTASVRFSEPIAEATLMAGFTLASAGPDKIHGNADDVAVTNGGLSYSAETAVAALNFFEALAPGRYEIRVTPPLSDAAGNVLAQVQTARFLVPGPGDVDGDDLPDDFELLLGLDPAKRDTNNNGVPDGLEDFDQDGLSNSAEILLGFRPNVADSDGNGINDGDEDRDFDGLSEKQEWAARTNPLNWDTDGDGFDDAGEIAEGLNPLSPSSLPPMRTLSVQVSYLNAQPYGPDVTSLPVHSAPVAYLNAQPYGPDVDSLPVVSMPAAYLNALRGAEAENAVITSPVAAYRNEP